MRLLLDTHVFLWYITGDERLPQNFRKSIEESDAAYLSVVSIWEAVIKYQLGKLPLPESPHPWLAMQRERHGIESSLNEAAVARLVELRDGRSNYCELSGKAAHAKVILIHASRRKVPSSRER